MKQIGINTLRKFWGEVVPISQCSYVWQPESNIAFCMNDDDRFGGLLRMFEAEYGHCYCFTSGEINKIPKKYRDFMLLIDMVQSIVRDGVDPKSVAMAIEQVFPGVLNDDVISPLYKELFA